ncbi:MAG: flagellar basal-body rod protein FlgF, partial [Planctomycetes bacterium]|nr:flagellar basal-body rod protein FlgF [Planctomycetota bacterium]
VLNSGGGTITIPAEGGKVIITSSGEIKQGDAVIGTVGVVEFDDLSLLMKQGKNLYAAAASATPRAATGSKIIPGALEGSTMDPVKGLVDMIEASRAFQMNANMISMQDTTLGRAVNEIARF